MKGCTTFFHLDVASYVQITILKKIPLQNWKALFGLFESSVMFYKGGEGRGAVYIPPRFSHEGKELG